MTPYGLGRLPSIDARDAAYPLRALMAPRALDRTYRHWATGWLGDQGETPQCVGYSTAAWLECSPVRHKEAGPFVDPVVLYHGAQANDEWPGEGYEGTSVRGAFKFLKAGGVISAYHWATSIEDVLEYLIHDGPMVFGTDWREGMFSPVHGILDCTGPVVGGHAYLVNGINLRRAQVRIVNSWGLDWGDGGRAWMSLEDADDLVFLGGGEAAAGVEVAP